MLLSLINKTMLYLLEPESNRAAKNAFNKKIVKYNKKCIKNGLKFLPIIIETTGKFPPVTDKLFNIILSTINNGMQPEYANISKFYRAARLYCCLQKSIACAIRRKYSISDGKAVPGLHFSHTN